MPANPAINSIVRFGHRMSINDPAAGAQGRVVCVREDADGGRTVGVDFAGFREYANTGRYDSLDGLLPIPTGCWLRPSHLTLVRNPNGSIPLSSRRSCMLDFFVGRWIQTLQDTPALSAGLGGVIHGYAVRDGEAYFGIYVPGIRRGCNLDGLLDAAATEGFWVPVRSPSLGLNDYSTVIPGMTARVTRETGPVPAGLDGLVVSMHGEGDTLRYGIDFGEGLALGNTLSGRLDRASGYNVSHENVQAVRVHNRPIHEILDVMAATPAIARFIPPQMGETPKPEPLIYDERLERERHEGRAPAGPQPELRVGDYVALNRIVSTDGTIGRVGRVFSRTLRDGSLVTGEYVTIDFGPGFRGHDGDARDGVRTRYNISRLSCAPIDRGNLPEGTRFRRAEITPADVERGFNGMLNGAMGTILGRATREMCGADGAYMIQADETHDDLHTCGGRVPRGLGYYLLPEHIIPVTIPRADVPGVQAPPPQRRGRPPGGGIGADIDRMIARAGLIGPGDVEDNAMPDVIGHIGTVVDRNTEMRANMIPLGAQGEIVAVDGRHYLMDFFPMALPHGSDGRGPGSRWSCPRTTIRIEPGGVLKHETPTLAKGDRVVVTFNGGGTLPPKDTEGVVLRVHSGQIADVDFYPYRWRHGKEFPGGNARSCAQVMMAYLRKVEVKDVETLKPYYLVKFEGGKMTPLEDQPTFESGQEASTFAKELQKSVPYKVQVRKLAKPDENWRAREEGRFKDGSYKGMPKGWDLTPIKDHYLHLSVTQPGQVAFTPNEEYGQQDRQIQTRPGAYVQKFYPHLDAKQVARYSALAACEGGLEVVNDADEMVRIYRLGEQGLGPDSCMKYDFVGQGHGGPRTPIHPVACYAAGDLALAYLRQDGAIVARCLIWPEKKLFTRAYGDLAKIIAVLEAEGYKRGNFIGARLRRVTFEYREQTLWVCPYVDESNSVQGNPGALSVYDDGQHLIIRPADQGQSTNQANGYIHIDRRFRKISGAQVAPCGHCGGAYDQEELRPVCVAETEAGDLVTEQWCAGCRKAQAYRCHGLDQMMSRKAFPSTYDRRNGDRISQAYVRRNGGYVCCISNKAYFDGKGVRMHDGRIAAKEYFDAYAFTCAGTGEKHMKKDDNGDPTYVKVGSKLYSQAYYRAHPEIQDELKRLEKDRHDKKQAGLFGDVTIKNNPYGQTVTSVRLKQKLFGLRDDDNPF